MSADRSSARDEEQLEHAQDDYNKRHEEYKENFRSARASHIGDLEPALEKHHVASANTQSRPAAGLSADRSNLRDEQQPEHAPDNYNKRHEEYKENLISARASHVNDSEFTPENRQVASANSQSRPAAGLSADRSNLRDEQQPEHAQDDYNKRQEEYKENFRSARASHIGDPEPALEKRHVASANAQSRPAAGLGTDSIDHRPNIRRLHDSHFLLGNQTHLQEEGGAHHAPNQKFADRYANRSLEATNVGETAGHSVEEAEDRAHELEAERERADDEDEEEREQSEAREAAEDEDDEAPGSGSSMNDNASSHSGNRNLRSLDEQADEVDKAEQRDIDQEIDAKASAGRADHRHFESEKSLPWLRLFPTEKQISEQMFLYLTHNELKAKIQDLEKRENQAASKHQWDEALRLRDMRNRLDLARERNLYRRDDLLLDPEAKRVGMAGIEARSKLLKQREMLCTNSSMYSEEAKMMWDQWLVEDQNSVLENARLQREDLMNQLENTWRHLVIEDKVRILNSFNDEPRSIDPVLQNDQDSLCAVTSTSR